jgi:hypothetical protein
MIYETDLYSDTYQSQVLTDEGLDYLTTRAVRVKGFAGVKAYNDERKRCALSAITKWKGAGNGWLEATYSWMVDASVVYDERRYQGTEEEAPW